VAIFHSGEQGELEDVIEHVKLELSKVTEKWLVNVVKPKTPWELIWALPKTYFLVLWGYYTKFSYSGRWDYLIQKTTWKTQTISMMGRFGKITWWTFIANESCKWRWTLAWNFDNISVQCKSFPFLCKSHLFFLSWNKPWTWYSNLPPKYTPV